jgi:hypothetical protein
MAVQRGRYIAIFLGLLGMSIAVSGCAVENIPYPELGIAKKLKNKILSREEQNDVIKDLTAEQAQHKSTAIDQIEKTQ